MHLTELGLFQFKNYAEFIWRPEEKINCITGKNGSGKTNLLDAIHYLSMTRSAFPASDAQNIQHGTSAFRIQARFMIEQEHKIELIFDQQKKTVLSDGEPLQKFSTHIGLFPVVMLSPWDIELIWGGSEWRRKMMDELLAQIFPSYLQHLILYTHYLKQRNSYLKSLSPNQKPDNDLLDSYDEPLQKSAHELFSVRKNFLAAWKDDVLRWYQTISSASDVVDIQYQSDLDEASMADWLKANRRQDVLLQRTTRGIHRDNWLYFIESLDLKKSGSQGQQKTFLTALKFAELNLIRQHKGFSPILLLDDIFDKLDKERMKNLMHLVSQPPFHQVFITDADEARARSLVGQLPIHFYPLHPQPAVV